jgi:hypothetical protein
VVGTEHIVIDKHELHPAWPRYSVIANNEIRDVLAHGVHMDVKRKSTTFGPGDSVWVRCMVRSDRMDPVRVRQILATLPFPCSHRIFKLVAVEVTIREVVIFRSDTHSPGDREERTIADTRQMVDKVLYPHEVHTIDLRTTIPYNHWRVTVNTAKHVEISYFMRVRGQIVPAGAGSPVSDAVIDQIPLQVSAYSRRDSEPLVALLTENEEEQSPEGGVLKALANEVLPAQSPPFIASGSVGLAASDEGSGARGSLPPSRAGRQSPSASGSTRSSTRLGSPDFAQDWGRVSQPGAATTSSYPQLPDESDDIRASTFPGRSQNSRMSEAFGLKLHASASAFPPTFQVANPSSTESSRNSAENEKRRLYEAASQQRDQTQSPPTSSTSLQGLNMWASDRNEKELLYRDARAGIEQSTASFSSAERTPSIDSSVGSGFAAASQWMTAQEEKKRYQAAQEQVRISQARGANGGEGSSSSSERQPVSSPPPGVTSPWLSAEEEKERLYSRAKAEAALGASGGSDGALLDSPSSSSSLKGPSPSASSYSSYPLAPGEKSMADACTYISRGVVDDGRVCAS